MSDPTAALQALASTPFGSPSLASMAANSPRLMPTPLSLAAPLSRTARRPGSAAGSRAFGAPASRLKFGQGPQAGPVQTPQTSRCVMHGLGMCNMDGILGQTAPSSPFPCSTLCPGLAGLVRVCLRFSNFCK